MLNMYLYVNSILNVHSDILVKWQRFYGNGRITIRMIYYLPDYHFSAKDPDNQITDRLDSSFSTCNKNHILRKNGCIVKFYYIILWFFFYL